MREVCIDGHGDHIACMMVPDTSSGQVQWGYYDAAGEEAAVRPYVSDEVCAVVESKSSLERHLSVYFH